MDNRVALPAGYALYFPGLKCTVEGELGRGSNAVVYCGWYEDASDSRLRHPVLIKELFPYHEKGGIFRDADGGILFSSEASGTADMHRESFRWGNEIHLKMKAKHPEQTGGNINTYTYNNTYYTLLDFSGGRTLDKELAGPAKAVPLRRIVQRFIGLLDALSVFHQMGFLHLDVSPDNVILLDHGRRERVELIDYNSVVPMDDLAAGASVRLSMKQGYASPEIRRGDLRDLGPWTDLYSAAAVLYFCLMEKPLSRMQLGGIKPVSVDSSRFLQDAPATVKAQLQKILLKGLAASGKRRYQQTEEMLQDCQELLNRIDGVGITHWALWETCAAGIRQQIGGNTGLAYLTEEEDLYPLELSDGEGNSVSSLVDSNGNAVITGSGGMGKTTLLLRTAWLENRCYRTDRPVVCYLSLADYTPGESNFIHNKLLRRMRFTEDTVTYDNARHTLDLLLQNPLTTKQGPRPVVYLLLDGYNEISGDAQALCREIKDLAGMDGVNIIIASRNGLPEYDFATWSVQPLKQDSVAEVLGKNGLLIPEEPRMQELLRNPMMLSLFVRACLNDGVQQQAGDEDALIQTYLHSLVDKELRSEPEESAWGWQVRAAVQCVLPVIAALAQHQSITSALMVREVSRLYRLLDSRLIKKCYPQWVGHIGDIRADADQAEAWYRLMIQDILWQRLGLLVRDSDGEYRLCHQVFRDALAPQGQQLLEAAQKRRHAGLAAGVISLLTAVSCAVWALAARQVPAYDPAKAIDMMGKIQSLITAMDDEVEQVRNLTDGDVAVYDFGRARSLLERQTLVIALDRAHPQEDGTVLERDGSIQEEFLKTLEDLSQTGQRLPWNRLRVEQEELKDAVNWFHSLQKRYLEYIDVLERVYTDDPENYEHCCQLIRDVLEADVRVCAAYYLMLYDTRMEGLEDWQSKTSEGMEFSGTANWMEPGSFIGPELQAAAEEMKTRMEQEPLSAILSQAEEYSSRCRSALGAADVYLRYYYFDE